MELNKSHVVISLLIVATILILHFANQNTNTVEVDCEKGDFECFSENLIGVLDSRGIKIALDSLEELYKTEEISSNDCHQFAHKLGRFASSKNGILKAAAQSSHICRSGYIHGVFESLGHSEHSEEVNIVELCSSGTFTSPAGRLQCLHGLGHGLTVAEKYNISASLGKCSQLSFNDAKVCATGAYMEAFGPSMNTEPADEQFQNIFDFCNANNFKTECYLYVGMALLRRNNNSFEISLQECNNAPIEFQESCRRGLGVLVARQTDYKPHKVVNFCSHNYDCWFGSASEYGQSLEIQQGLMFCKELPSTDKVKCIGEIWRSFSKHI